MSEYEFIQRAVINACTNLFDDDFKGLYFRYVHYYILYESMYQSKFPDFMSFMHNFKGQPEGEKTTFGLETPIPLDVHTFDYMRADYTSFFVGSTAILDVGAFIGDSYMVLHEVCPQAKIICVEPCEENMKCLVANVSKIASPLPILHTRPIHSSPYVVLRTRRKSESSLDETQYVEANADEVGAIKASTLDSFLEEGIDAVKLHAENGEYEAIQSAVQSLHRGIKFYIVIHSLKALMEIPPFIKSCNPKYVLRFKETRLGEPAITASLDSL